MADIPRRRPRSLDEAAGLKEPTGPLPGEPEPAPAPTSETIPTLDTKKMPVSAFRLPINGSHVIPISHTPSEPGFDDALAAGLAYEIQDDVWGGNFHLDPNGNPTKWGIDQTRHRGIDVANLTRDGAIDFYLHHPMFWPMAKSVPAAYTELRQVYFEGLVNAGGNATKALQRAVGMHGSEVDGSFGPKTRAALSKALNARGEEAIIREYLVQRKVIYDRIVAANPVRHAKNKQGWHNRVNDIGAWYDAVIKAKRTQA